MNCDLELAEAREIIGVFREENVRLEQELMFVREKIADALDLCNVLLNVDDRSVKILAGLIKSNLQKKESLSGEPNKGQSINTLLG